MEKAVVWLLLNAAGVTALVGQRIKPIMEHQGTSFPYITYQAISGTPIQTTDGASGIAEGVIQINAYAITYEVARAIIEAVRIALQGQSGTFNGVKCRVLVESGPNDLPESPTADKEMPVFGRTIDVNVMFTETIPS